MSILDDVKFGSHEGVRGEQSLHLFADELEGLGIKTLIFRSGGGKRRAVLGRDHRGERAEEPQQGGGDTEERSSLAAIPPV